MVDGDNPVGRTSHRISNKENITKTTEKEAGDGTYNENRKGKI